MIDRGIIKWQPFNSCFSGTSIINEINDNKNKEKFPVLSEDQLYAIEEKIKDAYTLKISINITYYYAGKIKTEVAIIKGINMHEKKICLNNKYIYFKQILKISY
ncbi:MAG: YolD-like family protein [Firmicutes bacterium]|nr:YolD-like family protein [Bacillota bacterium]